MASARIEITGKLTGEYSYERPSFGYGMETVRIYKIVAGDKVYVWKTTGLLDMQIEVPYETRCAYCYDDEKHKAYILESPDKGDTVTIKATIKGETEYNGEQQTEIQRVKLTGIIRKEVVKQEEKKPADLELHDGDEVLTMDYKRYKEHYADCETVAGSFYRDEYTQVAYIKVIVRAGRMKASGVRGKRFSGYQIGFTDKNGEYKHCSFRAVSEENALKQAVKAFPDCTNFNCNKIWC